VALPITEKAEIVFLLGIHDCLTSSKDMSTVDQKKRFMRVITCLCSVNTDPRRKQQTPGVQEVRDIRIKGKLR
jgi:hypothetical protein